jgi:hypothetical protein
VAHVDLIGLRRIAATLLQAAMSAHVCQRWHAGRHELRAVCVWRGATAEKTRRKQRSFPVCHAVFVAVR